MTACPEFASDLTRTPVATCARFCLCRMSVASRASLQGRRKRSRCYRGCRACHKAVRQQHPHPTRRRNAQTVCRRCAYPQLRQRRSRYARCCRACHRAVKRRQRPLNPCPTVSRHNAQTVCRRCACLQLRSRPSDALARHCVLKRFKISSWLAKKLLLQCSPTTPTLHEATPEPQNTQ